MWTHTYVFIVLLFASLTFTSPVHIARGVGFAADPSINAKGIFNAAKAGKKVLATYASGTGTRVNVFGDWLGLIGGMPLIRFMADMDVDCDGVGFRCQGNHDGQPQTSFGRLDANKVPFFVIPQSLFSKHRSQIKPNSLGAIICNGKMFYGIFGDTNGASPEVIGEASILMARSCFPNDGLSGNRGHTKKDVLYVLFGNQVPAGVKDMTIDIGALKRLGDRQARRLAKALRV